jgi:hypothetical protein
VATFTTRLGLYKPAADGSENVNVVSDLNDNWDRVDALVSYVPVTVGTYPASGYRGQAFYETDTGKGYINTSAAASTITKAQVVVAGANFDSNITLSSSAGQFTTGGTSSDSTFAAQRASAGDFLLSGRTISGSGSSRFTVKIDGTLSWGDGGGAATDVDLWRPSADTLAIDGALQVTGEMDAFADLNVSGDLEVSGEYIANTSAVFRPEPHIATTIASSSAEAALQTFAIPASDAAVGAVYRIRAYGTAQVTGTPTMTFRFRIGGVAGTALISVGAITARSGMTDGFWELEFIATCSATGVSGTFSPFMRGTHNFLTNATTLTHILPQVVASVTRDTTISNDLVLTGQWSASSPSNSIVCRGSLCERIA